MVTHALYVPLHAKPDKAEELQAFLREAQILAEQETGTAAWFALRLDDTHFAIFDAFPDEASRQAHVDGEIAKQLMAHADDLLADPPQLHEFDVVASKL
jgi:quinol monooxygenase YgiN